MHLARLLETAASRKTVFVGQDGETFDRSETVGASEVNACIRRTWYAKHGQTPDKPDQRWGYFARGHAVEEWVVSLLTDALEPGEELLYAGADQTTLRDGRISATPDGLLVTPDAEIAIEIKSLDPRSNLDQIKDSHVWQVHTQMGLFHSQTDHRPTRAHLIYVNASDYQDMRVHVIDFDPGMYDAAKRRAESVYTTANALHMDAEGVWTDDCRYCPFAVSCGQAVADAMPTSSEDDVDDETKDEIHLLVEARYGIDSEIKELTAEKKRVEEQIKTALRDADLRALKDDYCSVTYSLIDGRKTLDMDLVEEAGIDLSPYWKTGKPSERLTIRVHGAD